MDNQPVDKVTHDFKYTSAVWWGAANPSKTMNRIIHISIDQRLNSQVDFSGDVLEEVVYSFFTALGIEVVVTSEDEEVPEANNG